MKIRALEEKDASRMLQWIKDSRTKEWSQINGDNHSIETVLKFINNKSETEIHKAVVDENDVYLGTVSLKNIDYDNKAAEYAISMHYDAHGIGAAQFATKEILRFGFEELKLERIYWYVFSDNMRANGFYNKINAYFEGEFRNAIIVNGKTHNLKWYSVLKDEVNNLFLEY